MQELVFGACPSLVRRMKKLAAIVNTTATPTAALSCVERLHEHCLFHHIICLLLPNNRLSPLQGSFQASCHLSMLRNNRSNA
jgi:hypothetical protein